MHLYGQCSKDLQYLRCTGRLVIQPVMPSGWNRLNEDGDRYAGNYQILAYGEGDHGPGSYVYGMYDGLTDLVTWYDMS